MPASAQLPHAPPDSAHPVWRASDQLTAFHASAAHAGAEAALHTYPSAGHFYTDPSLPDYNPIVASRTWQHIDALLEKVRQRTPH